MKQLYVRKKISSELIRFCSGEPINRISTNYKYFILILATVDFKIYFTRIQHLGTKSTIKKADKNGKSTLA
jgi:hypothetical protein